MGKNDIYSNQLHSVIKVPSISTINYFRFGENFSTPKQQTNFWHIIFIEHGKAQIYSDGKQFILYEGELCFNKPKTFLGLSCNDKATDAIIIAFEAGGRIMSFFENKVFVPKTDEVAILKAIESEWKQCFSVPKSHLNESLLSKKVDAPFGSEQFIKNLLELFLISIVRNNFRPKDTKSVDNTSVSVHAEQMVENILEILNSRITTSVNLDDIAKELFFSKTYIKTVFKKYVGTSIIQYYNKLKIEKAKQLIAEKRYSITEITSMLGFSSVHYFSRLFKQISGLTPTEYEKTIK